MSVGIPRFLTLSEKPGVLRDKSGTLQNPDRFGSRHWNSFIKPSFLNENSCDYCSRSSRIDFRCFWIQRIPHFLPMPPFPQGVTGEYLHAFFASGYVRVSFQEFVIAAVAAIT
jgi:hypothetical protein